MSPPSVSSPSRPHTAGRRWKAKETARLSEARVRRSEQFYESAMESAHVGIWDLDLIDLTVNRTLEQDRIFGYQSPLPRWTYQIFLEHVIPEDRAEVDRLFKASIAEQTEWNFQCRIRRADGETRWIRISGGHQLDSRGAASRMAGIVQDITERRQEQKALRETQEQLRLFVEHSPAALAMFDKGLRTLHVSRRWMTDYGLGDRDLRGLWLYDVLPDLPDKWKESHRRALAGEVVRNEAELFRGADGTEQFVRSELRPWHDDEGGIGGILIFSEDVTERKKAEAELLRHTKALERSNQELDAFAYAASHDLKAPLRVIRNTSLWLEEDLAQHLTPDSLENMQLLRSRVRRMERLLEDLLEYSRIGRDLETRPPEAISGAALMADIIGLVAPPEGFTVAVDPSVAAIKAYRMPLHQVLVNLISNAIKHHDKKTGRIEVSVEDLGTRLRFSVKDDGPGIPPQFHEQIFKMFQTLRPRDQVEGSGLGLAIVRKHVESLGGAIKLESAVGQGSNFSFTWPKGEFLTQHSKAQLKRKGGTA